MDGSYIVHPKSKEVRDSGFTKIPEIDMSVNGKNTQNHGNTRSSVACFRSKETPTKAVTAIAKKSARFIATEYSNSAVIIGQVFNPTYTLLITAQFARKLNTDGMKISDRRLSLV
ncbi:hypothetical protein N24_0351 [Corynebacterium suranareeae]|uniref:Uncharacterized protein n=1 Tax=Corynebacterium suranareeae TaxID=2506452 RepID=A0A160PP02_9CORY|nr:hypothetical protein [Corynebacterium suranareeae]BAU94613.1 hypothetical protein N24_0351 [Corynebacterium suranareeae]